MRHWLPAMLVLGLAACSSAPKKPSAPGATAGGGVATAGGTSGPARDCSRYAPAQEDPSTRGHYTAGGLYKPGVSDTTPDHVPDLACIREPVVTREAYSAVGNRSPYSVLGKQYHVRAKPDGYVETGTASYYGAKFHGRKTSNQEVYDMYAFTAAHKTLPLPSFARVTNLDNGESVIVRVNDRGPFHEGRIIDLSYAAAVKLGITQRGTGRVEVRAVTPDDVPPMLAATPVAPATKPQASGMDALVGQLPAGQPVPAATVAVNIAGQQRYHVVPDLKDPPSAERFDAWMQANGVRVATGKPASPAAASLPSAAVAPVPTPTLAVASPPATSLAATGPLAGMPIQLQVASFASRENADRALARLTAAGIGSASLSDVDSNGRRMWRLRVGANGNENADELANRIASLGFGRPRIIHE